MVHQHFALVQPLIGGGERDSRLVAAARDVVLASAGRARDGRDRRAVPDADRSRARRSGSCPWASSSASRSSRRCTAARGPHPGRADDRTHTPGGAAALRDAAREWPPTAQAWCSSRTSCPRCSPSPTGSRCCAAARRWGRCRTADSDARSLAHLMVGRDILLTRKESKAKINAGEDVLALSDVSATRGPGHSGADRASRCRCGPVRSWASRESPGTASVSWPRSSRGSGPLPRARSPSRAWPSTERPGRPSTPGSAMSPRSGWASAWPPACRSPTTSS